jgi:ArsR family transcriptional regulator, arsenate/arsenite/antimonite-responsive transcriptional repressor
MVETLKITKALADENRLRIIAALEGRELCVCQLIELLDLAPSTVSKHLSILKNARLTNGRKEGRWMYYRLAGTEASACVKSILLWFRECTHGDTRIQADKQNLKEILKMDREVLCRR